MQYYRRMTPFESCQRVLRELTRVSPYSYMVMKDKIGLYFQNALVARLLDQGDVVQVEFNESTPADARAAILNFLATRQVPHRVAGAGA